MVLDVIAEGIENGRVISRQARNALDGMFESVRADIVADYFVKEHNAGVLVKVAKELDDCAHCVNPTDGRKLSTEAKSILGVYADFVQAKRAALLGGGAAGVVVTHAVGADGGVSTAKAASKQDAGSNQADLFQGRKPQ